MPITQKWLNQMSTFYIFLKSGEKSLSSYQKIKQGALFFNLPTSQDHTTFKMVIFCFYVNYTVCLALHLKKDKQTSDSLKN